MKVRDLTAGSVVMGEDGLPWYAVLAPPQEVTDEHRKLHRVRIEEDETALMPVIYSDNEGEGRGRISIRTFPSLDMELPAGLQVLRGEGKR